MNMGANPWFKRVTLNSRGPTRYDESGPRRVLRSSSSLMYIKPFGISVDRRSGNLKYYMSFKKVGRLSFGNRRIRTFLKAVALSPDICVGNSGPEFWAIRLTVLDLTQFSGGYDRYLREHSTDYGLTGAINSVKLIQRGDENQLNPLNVAYPSLPELVAVQTSLISRRTDIDSFVDRLKDEIFDVMPAPAVSGSSLGDLRIMGLSIVEYTPLRAGMLPELSDKGYSTLEALSRKKSCMVPDGEKNCFWVCMSYFISKRDSTSTNSLRKKYASLFFQENKNKCAEEFSLTDKEMETVCISDVNKFAAACSISGVVVIDIDGEVLIGESQYLDEINTETNKMMLLFYENHFVLVMSYTGFLFVKKCYLCKDLFKLEKDLRRHLKKASCLTCECQPLEVGKKRKRVNFLSEEEFRHHIDNRDTVCPLRNGSSESEKNQKKATNSRFLTAVRPVKRHQYAIDEEIYFDLETIVPIHRRGRVEEEEMLEQFDMKCDDFQRPYAAGWITKSSLQAGYTPTIAYGLDCMTRFISFLDSLFADITTSVNRVIKEDVNEIFESGDELQNKVLNKKIKISWRKMVNLVKDYPSSCERCCDVFTEKAEMLAHCDSVNGCSLHRYILNKTKNEVSYNAEGYCPRVCVWAHNGGKFDWVFLHRWFMEQGRCSEIKSVRSGGKYINLSYKGLFRFVDSCLFMAAPLERLAHDYNVEVKKGVFPYRYMKSVDNIYDVVEGLCNLREQIPPDFFKITDTVGNKGSNQMTVKRPYSLEEWLEYMNEKNNVFDVQKVTTDYLIDDVMCLAQIMTAFCKGWSEMVFSPRVSDFDTIGQLTHDYFIQHFMKEGTYSTLSIAEDKWTRQALFGGRTEVMTRYLNEFDLRKIYYYDVNSLYPFVMESRDLPGGTPEWYLKEDDPLLPRLREDTNFLPVVNVVGDDYLKGIHECLTMGTGFNESIFGFIDVMVIPPENLLLPVLPERKKMGATTKNMFDLVPRRCVYYSEELKFALERGYVIHQVFGWCKWERIPHYNEFINTLKTEKMRGEGKDVQGNVVEGLEPNPSLRSAAKLASNSSFGKTIQNVDCSYHLVSTHEEVWKLVKGKEKDCKITPVFQSVNSDVVEVKVKYDKIQKRSCAAIGTAILAEARMELYKYFEVIHRIGGQVLYCDTDSVVYAGNSPLPEEMIHSSVYGKMKLEIDPEKICGAGFVALSPKCYAFQFKDGSPYVKCKGVPLSENLITSDFHEAKEEELAYYDEGGTSDSLEQMSEERVEGLNFDIIRGIVKGSIASTRTNQLQFVKDSSRNVIAYNVQKKICDNFDKRRVLWDGTTLPWTPFNIFLQDIYSHPLNGEFANTVSNFFNKAESKDIFDVVKGCWTEDKCETASFIICIYGGWVDNCCVSAMFYESDCLENKWSLRSYEL
jgi:hypothetical protein